ncbi:TRAP transporter substrate-binding protein [Polaromonas sp.]|uniref:TRAP transporter substrate-binding protein n=1 Tax=Polaromonas sp. TaxID=1869339 RepID=UPI003BAB9FAF
MNSIIFKKSFCTGLFIAAFASAGVSWAQTKWDLAIAWPAGNFHTKNAVAFAEAVDKATRGQVKITVHSGGALGLKGAETMRAVRDGIVPMAEFSVPQHAGDAQLFVLEAMPYLASSYEELRALHDVILPEYDKVFAKFGQKRLYMVPWPNQYIFSKKAIEKTADAKGLKIRTTDRSVSELLKGAGMAPIQMSFADMMPALASGGLDAVGTSAPTAVDSRFWEFMKFGYKTNHIWSSNALTVNLAAWNKLTPQQRTAIEKVAKDLEPGFWKASQEEDAKAIAIVKEKGMRIEPMPDAVTAELKKVGQAMTADYAKATGEPVPTLLKRFHDKTGK